MIYHNTARTLAPVSLFRKEGLRLSAFDSTHPDEEHPRTYKIEEMSLFGVTRIRPQAIALEERR